MRLRPGLRLLPRGDGEVQVGVDPRWATRLTDLTAREAAALLALPDGAHLSDLAHDEGIDVSRLARLVDDLDAAGLIDRAPDHVLTGPGAADTRVLGLLRPDGRGDLVVAARSARTVGVHGLDRTGLAVALGLATSGVGAVVLEDEGVVRSDDLGAGYRWSDVGTPRLAAAARAVADAVPSARVETRLTGHAPDVLVLVAGGALDSGRAAALVSAAATHLPVVIGEVDVAVGPLVVPGRGPCTRCLDLHRADADPAWATVAAALAGAPPARLAPTGPTSTAAASVATALVVAHLDGLADAGASADLPTPGSGIVTSYAIGVDALARERRWAAHPSCGCAALSAVPGPMPGPEAGPEPGPELGPDPGQAAGFLRGRPRPRLVATTSPETKT
ncbi:ThiF family adenylyltransferase [Cellulomonas composti]|uniref:Thiamin biosynthesis protein n=1 Tax=Cellulomonas composti TaxID=266130 RepID=A0A511J9C4_9CELL|nr:ThiF family adenylyltransferase [Cellulomonas composti]GEL94595.1 thiamin biosynthesis protein [Cellulomonas composti]